MSWNIILDNYDKKSSNISERIDWLFRLNIWEHRHQTRARESKFTLSLRRWSEDVGTLYKAVISSLNLIVLFVLLLGGIYAADCELMPPSLFFCTIIDCLMWYLNVCSTIVRFLYLFLELRTGSRKHRQCV